MQGTRRQFIQGAGVAAAAGLAGCSDVTGTIGDGGERPTRSVTATTGPDQFV